MSNDALALNFEKQWAVRVRQNTEFLHDWAQVVLGIDHTQEDTTSVLEHYRWAAILGKFCI